MSDYQMNVYSGATLLETVNLRDAEPTPFNLGIYRGDSFTRTFEVIQVSSSTPLDLSGSAFAASVRKFPDATGTTSDPLVDFTVDTTQASSGRITITLLNLQTATLGSGAALTDSPVISLGAWDLEETRTDTTVFTWLVGRVTLTEDISYGGV